MMSNGSFQAQHDIAKSAAAQAVARQRSEWEALMYANDKQAFTVDQMKGLGRDDALMKVQSVRLEAKQMQSGTFMTKVLDAKGNIVDQEVKLSVGVLNDFAETAAWKGASKKLTEGLSQQYGTIEKRYFRGPDSDWAKANRLTGTDRLSRFVTVDADTDYLQHGHINMVEGKWSHLAAKGKYDAYKTLRLNEAVEVERHATANIQSLITSVNATAVKKGKPELSIPVGLSFAEIAKNPAQKAAIMAQAASAMKDAKIPLPLSDFQYRAERVSYREVMQKSMRNQRQLRILEKENQEAIMKDSVKESMIRVKMDDNVKRVTRGTNPLGRRFEISEGPESINEKAYYAAINRIAGNDIKKRGDDKTIELATLQMSKFNAIFNDVASLSSKDVIIEHKIDNNLFVQKVKAKELGEALVKYVDQERLGEGDRKALFEAYNLKASDYNRAKDKLISDDEMVESSEQWSFLEGSKKSKKNKN
jgi:hypothetical protein